jgi:hypothetical protein
VQQADRRPVRQRIEPESPPHLAAFPRPERYAPRSRFEPADRHAEAFRNLHGISESQPFDVMAIIEERGWHVVRRSLGAAQGGLQAGIVPSRRTEFRITVDSEPTPTEVWEYSLRPAEEVRQVLERSRLAHELGHTLFYRLPNRSGETSPVRLAPSSGPEEAFCDRFAATLLVPSSAARTAVRSGADHVLQVARHFAAPVAAVLDAAAGGVRAAAGLGWCRPGRILIGAEPLLTYDLPDSCLLWDDEPRLRPALIDHLPRHHGGAVSFLALCPGDAPLSVLVSPWPAGEAIPEPRYLVLHADMGFDAVDARAVPLGSAR